MMKKIKLLYFKNRKHLLHIKLKNKVQNIKLKIYRAKHFHNRK